MTKTLLIISLALMIGACSTTRISNIQGEVTSKIYKGAYAECKQRNDEEIYLNEKLNRYLKAQKIFGNDIKIECEVSYYDEGNRVARYFLGGWGFTNGAAKSEMNIRLADENNKTIATFSNSSKLTAGVFGGDATTILDESARKIVNHIKKMYIKKQ